MVPYHIVTIQLLYREPLCRRAFVAVVPILPIYGVMSSGVDPKLFFPDPTFQEILDPNPATDQISDPT